MLVSLTKEEVRLCADMALNRWMMKWGSTDRPNYDGENKKKLEPEISANVRAIVAEYAVAKFYKLPHVVPFYPNNEHYFRKDIPDVLNNIEVRTVRTRDAIPVWKKDNRPHLMIVGTHVVDRDYYSEVDIYGWISAEECFKKEWYWAPEDSYRVPKEAFSSEPLGHIFIPLTSLESPNGVAVGAH